LLASAALHFEHAFSGGRGSIGVSVRSGPGDRDAATMTVTDDGAGFEAKAESKRHGLGLVRRLVEQVRGTASLDSENGTVWTIRIPRHSTVLSIAIKPNPVAAGEAAA
jgi:two-component sensor histidine kinase